MRKGEGRQSPRAIHRLPSIIDLGDYDVPSYLGFLIAFTWPMYCLVLRWFPSSTALLDNGTTTGGVEEAQDALRALEFAEYLGHEILAARW